MKFLKVILGVLILNSQLLIMNCLAKGAGSSAVETLTQPVSAKAAAMGDAYSSLSGDVVSLHFNPAGLSTLRGSELSTMYQKGLDEDTVASVLFGTRFSKVAVGLSVLYYDTGKIELFDLSGNEINKIGQRDIIVTLGSGIPIFKNTIGLGFNIKAISSEIFGEKATAFAADIGVQYRGLVDIGVSAQNFGTSISYKNDNESLPKIVRAGFSYKKLIADNSVTASIDFPHYINEEETFALAGIEYRYDHLFALRAGYKSNLSGSSGDDENNITGGLGLIWGNYSVDYAIGVTENLSNPHYISFKMKFAGGNNKPKKITKRIIHKKG